MTSVSAPQVSFCIPTYNRCRYLASLLESLLVQLADFPFSLDWLDQRRRCLPR